MRIGALATMVFALLIGLPIASMADPAVAGLAPDTDLTYAGLTGEGPDGIPDVTDNCDRVNNPTQCDTNSDGLGNRCDCDLDNDGDCQAASDFAIWKICFNSVSANDPHCDMDCDSDVDANDFGLWKEGFKRSPPSVAAPGNLSGCLNGVAGC